MKKILTLGVLILFLISLVIAANGIQNQGKEITQEQAKKIMQTRNRLKIHDNQSECPYNCTCDGSTTKCQIEERREMTIQAGKSGNTIFQVKDTNISTKVELYQSEGKIYGNFKNNQTKEINVLPDQIKEKIRAKIKTRLENQEIELDEEGNYQVKANKRARLFGLIPVNERVRIEIDSETGEIIRTRNSWWGFLASDEEEQIVGGCGTVTPGLEDECCQNLGYAQWNSETVECE